MKLLLLAAVVALLGAQSIPAPRFEVASVKPNSSHSENVSMTGGPLPQGPFNQEFMRQGTHDPGRIMWTNVWLGRVIQVAYDFPLDRISGPDWLGPQGVDARYDIAATMPASTSVDDFKVMLQNLLADRFKLALHRGTKDVSGYALEIAKSGLKIQQSGKTSASERVKLDAKTGNELMAVDQSGFPAPRPGNAVYLSRDAFEATIPLNGRYRATILNESMSQIAAFFGRFAGVPTVDQTGLAGKYDLHLEFAPAAADAANPAADPGPELLDAIQSQLGLKLVPKKVPVETLVIDHVEKVPSEN